jgi:hypothetical protein
MEDNRLELFAQIRGSSTWNLIESDDARVELQSLAQTMRRHGFKVITDGPGGRRVINPITGECEVIYRLAHQLHPPEWTGQ